MAGRISRAIAQLRLSESKKDAKTGFSVASLDKREIAFVKRTYFQDFDGKKKLEIMFRNSWAVNRAINVRANLMSSRGLKIKTTSDKQKKVITDFLKQMHPTRPMLALQNSFRARSLSADIFGNAFDELLFDPAKLANGKVASPEDAKAFLGFSPMHPINTDFIREEGSDKIAMENNVPEGYHFNADPSGAQAGGINLPLKRVGHLAYNRIADELLGMSLIEPIYKTAERLMKIEEGMAQGVLTYGNPTRDFICGDAENRPTKKMMDDVADTVEDYNNLSEYVHPYYIRVSQMESFSLGKIPNYVQPFVTAIAAETRVPEFLLLGRGEGTNKATAQAMINFVHQTIEPLQQAQAMYFEEQIMAPLMKLNKIEEVPTIEWNDILPRTIADSANVIKSLSEVIVNNKQIFSAEELREISGVGDKVSFKKESKSELSEITIEVPKSPGICITTQHAELICKGKKKLIIKSRDFSDMTLKQLYLVSENKVYGIIKLRTPEKINLEQFDDLNKEHRITDDEREDWWPNREELFAYRFNVLQLFTKPKKFDPPKNAQTFIQDVRLDTN